MIHSPVCVVSLCFFFATLPTPHQRAYCIINPSLTAHAHVRKKRMAALASPLRSYFTPLLRPALSHPSPSSTSFLYRSPTTKPYFFINTHNSTRFFHPTALKGAMSTAWFDIAYTTPSGTGMFGISFFQGYSHHSVSLHPPSPIPFFYMRL